MSGFSINSHHQSSGGEMQDDETAATATATATTASSKSSSINSSRMTVYYHPDCAKHEVSEEHPETPERVKVTLDRLRELTSYPFVEAPLATKDHILLFHTEDHWNSLNEKFLEVAHLSQSDPSASILVDSDTIVSQYTEAAALRAVGSVIQAIDDIYSKKIVQSNSSYSSSSSSPYMSSFCCVRPPGHHAEPDRACGFCFFNNAGIAARYAQSRYGVNHVAVLDFDVHHGNGTEEGFKHDETLFYGSTHEEGNFPGTGPEPIYIGEDVRTLPIHRRIVNRKTRPGLESKVDFRRKWKEVLKDMMLFSPDLVIISAGFDAHASDPVGNSYLVEEDFRWATELVFKALHRIDPTNSVPVISVLEGGYDIPALADSIVVHSEALERGYDCCDDDDDDDDIFDENQDSCNDISIGEGISDGDEVAAMARYIESLGISLEGLNTSINSEFNNVFNNESNIIEENDDHNMSQHNTSSSSMSVASTNAMSTSISTSWSAGIDQDLLGDFIGGAGGGSRSRTTSNTST